MIRLLIGAAVGLAVSLVLTRFLIDWLHRLKIGQPIHEDVPEGHRVKAGTPTMGGVAMVTAAVLGYLGAHVPHGTVFTRSGLLLLGLVVGAGLVGLLDDWIKVSQERNLGLNKRTKILGLLLVAVGFSVGLLQLTVVHTTIGFTRFDHPGIEVGKVGWAVLAVLLIMGTTNAVNLTDGLDGLAAGSASLAFIAYALICFWAFRYGPNNLTHRVPNIYHVAHALDLALVSAAMAGACIGFLWWNAHPARIIMGDTGSLAIGAGLAGVALSTNTQLLLPIVGALYVAETVSVILQVGSFRLFHRRIFRMAPIHHHFEMAPRSGRGDGWPETTVIVRFWILGGLCTMLALGFFYADFLRYQGLTL